MQAPTAMPPEDTRWAVQRAEAQPRLEMGRVVGQSFGVLARNPVSVIVLCLVVSCANPASRYLGGLLISGVELQGWMRQAGFSAITTVLNLATQAFLLGALAPVVLQAQHGRKLPLSAAVAAGLRAFLPVTLIYLASSVGYIVGMLCLIGPGVYLMLRWAVAGPACAIERTGFIASFSRSAVLTQGHRWAILGLTVAYLVLVSLITVAVVLIDGGLTRMASLQAHFDPTAIALQVLSGFITLWIGTCGASALYAELRRIREGAAPSEYASVFE